MSRCFYFMGVPLAITLMHHCFSIILFTPVAGQGAGLSAVLRGGNAIFIASLFITGYAALRGT
ncbi:hypothetical protein O3P16_12505 [Chitinophagaceae bacterium LY-5]|uniref:Uncharacterized protein n=1 Tax=Polluticaenibacter yanchengensis TaxID=3014562 RepID=A0ABT4ULA5_9BACT|nr:hypothetical protein [Chitinophagaceae bacterium LY-5]